MRLKTFRLFWLSALLLAAVMIPGACSDDDSDPGGPAASITRTPTPTPSPEVTGRTPIPGPGVSATQITIGMTNDLSGTGDTPFAAVTEAMQAYFRKANEEESGACGRDINLQAEDDGYQAQLAYDKTKAMVESGSVLAMVGALNTEAHQPVAAYLNDPNGDGNPDDGVPDLFLSTGWSGWGDTARYPWTVGYIPDYYSDGAVIGRYIAENFAGKKVGVIYRDDLMGRDYFAGVGAGVGAAVQQEPFPADATTADDQLTRLSTAGAEVVVLAAPPEITANIIKKSAEVAYRPTWAVSYVSTPSELARYIGGGSSAEQLLEGFRLLSGTISTHYLLSPVEDETAPAIIEHQRIMQTYQGPMISSLSVYGQSLAETIVEALRRSCGDLTRAGLLAAAESMALFEPSLMLPGITVDLGENDHLAIESMQPVVIKDSGIVNHAGAVISAADLPVPTLAPTPIAPVSPTPAPGG